RRFVEGYDSMKIVGVTPEKTFVEQDATFVVVPLYDGEYGIGLDHSPVVGRIGAGEMRLTLEDGSVESWYVEGGFVEVVNNTISLLVNRACETKSLNVDEARKRLQEALQRPSNSPELIEMKAEAVERARAQLRFAQKFQTIKS
ncbi:MAG: ATP synthase F1 subunit epsilon, partial [Thermoguttaceae bacterium]|nr:ATP synthase F1 subunit epsilon [Thermoguttaceae bacterium]